MLSVNALEFASTACSHQRHLQMLPVIHNEPGNNKSFPSSFFVVVVCFPLCLTYKSYAGLNFNLIVSTVYVK